MEQINKRGCPRCGKPTTDSASPDRVLYLSYQDFKFHQTLPPGHTGEDWVFGKDCHRAILANKGVRDW